jgi:L-amino acid N-acyltransferase YncA
MKIECIINSMTDADWEQVLIIYTEGIETGHATLETEAPGWESWNLNHLPHCRLVAGVDETIKGWAALSPVSTRSVYSGVAEVSVYVSESARGCGVGSALLNALIVCSEEHGIWTLQAGILAENNSSLKLHSRCGFREVGRRVRIGRLRGRWRDVILMERRSEVAGL